ncbi:MAG TPA: potassium transporter TrkG [Thermomicrobiales bacterium]|nr:potassium transporter TrkG [Thermomicrobiales bacterium]
MSDRRGPGPQGRLPGNRVVRRRVAPQQVIDIPPPPTVEATPNAVFHARQFLGAYLVLVLLGTSLLTLPWANASNQWTKPLDAFFTAVSASAVTGLVVVDTQTHWSLFGEIVILALIQAGGLGFMVGASLLLTIMRQGQSLRGALLLQDGMPTMSLAEALQLSRHILRFLLVVEAIGTISLTIYFMQYETPLKAFWHGLFTAVSAFCNAGFDLQGSFQSMAVHRDSWWLNLTIMALIQSGALSFIVFNDIWVKRRWRLLALDVKLVLIVNAALIVVGTLVYLGAEWGGALGDSVHDRIRVALFQSVSLRTAGFATVNFADLHMATLFASMAIMAVGGAAGSTAGGIKLATVGVIAVAIRAVIRGDESIQVFGRRISDVVVYRAMSVVVLYITTHFVMTLALSVTEQIADHSFGFVALMFETMSGLATVGLSTGITPAISDPGKLVLCLTMMIGRLGPVTLAYALQGKQHRRQYRLPDAPIRIG